MSASKITITFGDERQTMLPVEFTAPNKPYNGWSNYQTYRIKGLIDCEPEAENWRAYTACAIKCAPDELMVEKMGRALLMVRDALKATFDDHDTANVNWFELAEALVIEAGIMMETAA